MKTRCGAEGQIRQQMEPANQENSRFRPLGFRQPDVRTGVATTFHRHNSHAHSNSSLAIKRLHAGFVVWGILESVGLPDLGPAVAVFRTSAVSRRRRLSPQ